MIENKLYALHFQGKLLESKIWKQYSKKYGSNSLYGWRPSKKVYFTIGHAKAAIIHLPKEIRDQVEIVTYAPQT